MNETSYGTGAGPSTGTGRGPHPQQTPPHQDLDRLRRSTSDRYIAGVAGGLGRHFDVDPTVIRVLLAVLTLFGGAGVLIYGVCWAFVPEDTKAKANINISSDARKILLLAAAGVAVLLAMGDAFSGFNAGWPIASIAVIVAVVMIARDRRNDRKAQRGGQPAYPVDDPAPYAGAYATVSDGSGTTTLPPAASEGPEGSDVPPPAWRPPVVTPPILPPHPKRTGIVWFWPTLAMIAIALGIIGIYDGSHHVFVGVYPATALAITGVMLLVGSIVGRAGGLILLGVLSTMTLSAATVLGTFDFHGQDLRERPTTAAAVQPSYDVHMGRIELDLTRVRDYQALAGRSIDLHLIAGEIKVIVPRELNLEIDAELEFAGGINVPGYDGGGFEDSADKFVAAVPASDAQPLDLDLKVRVGHIEVERR